VIIRLFHYHAIGDPVFLRRWTIVGVDSWGLLLHQFVRSDHDRACHDHPWNYLTFILWGGYWERFLPINAPAARACFERMEWRRPWSLLYRPAIWRHRIELERTWDRPPDFDPSRTYPFKDRASWSLVFVGPRRQPWGFWVPDYLGGLTWCWWRKYDTDKGICEDRIIHHEGED
jgi:hypothetical protein